MPRESRDARFARLSALLPRSNAGEYWAGYRHGIRRWYHGEKSVDAAVLAELLADAGERGRGYREGCAGHDPAPRVGRPPVPAEELARVRSIRLNDARWAKLQSLRAAEPGWLERMIDEA
jgi:hypothetical protein